MKEPFRMLVQGATAAERALLDSARADAPPEGAAQRLLVALEGAIASGAPGTAGSGLELGQALPGAGAAATSSLKLAALAKVGLAALVGVGALGGGVLLYRHAGPSASSPPSVVAQPSLPPAPPVVPAAVPGQVAEPLPSSAETTMARGRSQGATDESLSAELRLLDVARAAVDARNPEAAQRALDAYAQRFPRGRLEPEAAVLRLAVLVRQGQRSAAQALAARLLASEAYEAYAYRIRSLLREVGE